MWIQTVIKFNTFGELQVLAGANNHVIWTHNQKTVYIKKGSYVTVKELDTDHSGSLILENIQINQSGKYKGEVYSDDGTFKKGNEAQLCVQEPVAEPTVIFKCAENGVTLTCSALNHSEVVVSWKKNGKKESNMANAVLHANSSDLKAGDNFSCTVKNMISVKSAKDVQPVCSDTEMSEKTFLFGLDFRWMLVVLTGGGTFLLILLICIVGVCCCYRRRHVKKEQDYRLAFLMPDKDNQPDCQNNRETASQRTSEGQSPLPPISNPRRPPSFPPSYI
ncbi:T-cell surface antigen CD2-like [Xyrauchen texanus]|uniref:T-cell surface antigen CD2-like n=1 Tax=Xyrauchen texanus TaxID=154827 RepID=UPI002242BF8F|nr:T-cell surface antigen CD2-like [Xyrauchen texanus]